MSRKKVAIRNIPNRLLPTRPGRASTIGLRAIGRSKNKRVSSDTHGVEPDGEVFSIVLPLAGTGGRPNRCTVCKQRSWRSVSWPIPCLSHARRRPGGRPAGCSHHSQGHPRVISPVACPPPVDFAGNPSRISKLMCGQLPIYGRMFSTNSQSLPLKIHRGARMRESRNFSCTTGHLAVI